MDMFISEKLNKDIISVNIISKDKSTEIENMLRKENFGATCYEGIGRNGPVKVINVICNQYPDPKIKQNGN